MGRDGAYRTTEPGKRHFNPRARVGRDIPSARRLSIMRYFNPRARVGRDRGIGATCQGHGHFNPRARVGRDNTPNKSGRDSPISIHAPAWGATLFFSGTVSMRSISIHAPAWGATPVGRYAAHLRGYFNPRARVGRDPPLLRSPLRGHISIHAPAWGATVPVYTGLITAVALYFSRTSFLAVLLQAFFVAKSSV